MVGTRPSPTGGAGLCSRNGVGDETSSAWWVGAMSYALGAARVSNPELQDPSPPKLIKVCSFPGYSLPYLGREATTAERTDSPAGHSAENLGALSVRPSSLAGP